MQRGTLILEDQSEFPGYVFGASTNTTGEVGKLLIMDFVLVLGLHLFSLPNGYGGLCRIIN